MGQICSFCGSDEEREKAGAFADTSSTVDAHDSHHSGSLLSQQQTPNGASPSAIAADSFNNQSSHASSSAAHDGGLPGGGGAVGVDPAAREELDRIEEEDRQRRMAQYRLEQVELARREAIVAEASRSMVPVGSSGGNLGGGHHHGMMMGHQHHHHSGGGGQGGAGNVVTYYDPAYAAAAAQDILRSAAITGGLVFTDDRATRDAWGVSMVGSMPRPATTSSSRESSSPLGTKDVAESLGRGRWDDVRLGSRGSGLAGCGGEDPEYYLDDLAEAFLETMVPTKTSLFGGCASIVENLP